MADLVPKLAQGLLDELASALRVVIVGGPRQSGKTTMLRQYQRAHGGSYRTLDNRQDHLLRRLSGGARAAVAGRADSLV